MIEKPASIRTVRDTVPEYLEQAVMKALAKVPADRFESAEEMVGHLEGVHGVPTVVESGLLTRIWTRYRILLQIGVAVVVVATSVRLLTMGSSPMIITTSNHRQITLDPGLEYQPAASPDGNYVAYVAGDIGGTRLYVKEITGGKALSLTNDLPGYQTRPKWGPGGHTVRFLSCVSREAGDVAEGTPSERLCFPKEIPKFGGPVTPIERSEWNGDVSPDGSRTILWGVGDSIIVAADSRGERTFIAHLTQETDSLSGVWGPNSERFVWVDGNSGWTSTGNISASAIWMGDAVRGGAVSITNPHPEYLNIAPVWLDSRHLLFVSDRDGTRGVYVVEVDRQGSVGEPRLIPGVSRPGTISVSSDRSRLAYSEFDIRRNVSSIPIPYPGDAVTGAQRAETVGNQTVEFFDVSPDGDSLVFDSDRGMHHNIYKSARGESQSVRLTTHPAGDWAPAWSPDGGEIAFYSVRSGLRQIWTMAADGSDKRQITHDTLQAYWPRWSPDGLAIVYQLTNRGNPRFFLVARDSVGGTWAEPTELTDTPCMIPHWVPDGERIVCQRRAGGLGLSSMTGDSLSTLTLAGFVSVAGFSADGRTMFYLTNTNALTNALWSIELGSGNDPVRLAEISTSSMQTIVRAGRVYFSPRELTSDIWVMDLECAVCGESLSSTKAETRLMSLKRRA